MNYALSLFATAPKVTKNAAPADKRLKINSHAAQENNSARRNRASDIFSYLNSQSRQNLHELILLTPFLRGGSHWSIGVMPMFKLNDR